MLTAVDFYCSHDDNGCHTLKEVVTSTQTTFQINILPQAIIYRWPLATAFSHYKSPVILNSDFLKKFWKAQIND